MKSFKNARKRLFFLLEILVAIAIVALGIMPLLTMEWGIYAGERFEKTLFRREQEIKKEALETIQELYRGKYLIGQLEEGVELVSKENPNLLGQLLLENGTISISYLTAENKERLFQIAAKVKSPEKETLQEKKS